MSKIWCLGIANLDVLTQPVDRWPERGGLVLVNSTDLQIGGVALNTAVTIGKLGGIPVGLIAHIGNDLAGQVLRDSLRAMNVDTTHLVISESQPTGTCIVCVHPGGERSFLYCFGANGDLCEESAMVEDLAAGDYLHVGGALGMAQFNGQPLARLLQWAQGRGMTTSVDTTWDVTEQWWPSIAPALPHVDVFMTNELEAKHLTGQSDPWRTAECFAREGARIVIVKQGASGCYVHSEDWQGQVPAFKVEVVDTTGAGDAFAGAFIYGLARGWGVEQATTFANAVGALCVTALGATTGVRSCSETLDLIRTRGRAGAWNWEM
ncbi:MAG: carbohydrate kinase family protein [Chloroflexi bacterium]|nr:carbohydrate kinase family protein [Chloroflexota bacterium]